MASSGNTNPNIVPNQQAGVSSGGGGGGGFDMNKFFKPATLPPPPAASSPSYAAAAAAAAAGAISFAPSASFPPPSGQYSFPPQTPPYYHPHPHMPNFPPQDHHVNLLPQRSVSFPVPPLQPVPNSGQSPNPNPNPNSNPNHGARLMAMLTPPPNFEFSNHPPTPMPTALSAPTGLQPSSSAEFLMPPSGGVQQMVPVPGPTRMPSSKLPRGRHLVGDRMVYDVEARLPGEEQPQLEVTPITKYVSDPGLILGHQIAVSKTYICYGLKMGNIRVLNINTALRSLLRGHTQRVTDMAFFAEDVHLLASASIEGRVCVWKISEGPDDEGKPQISGHVVLAIHITSDDKSIHPRVCWHCHKQEILVVAIGKNIFRIDTLKLCKGTDFSAEEPLLCPVDKLVDGVQLVGKHDGEVTDLSMCQWMTTRLVSASKDGTIKIWEDRKALPLLELKPHDGQPVDAAKFLSSPHQLGHIILITAGPLNREVKLWASSGDEGWLLPSDAESWRCTQTLELKRSGELRNEDVFFNQVVALSQAGLLLLANAKKNAIYAIHLEYGANPAATHMDYLAEFTVTMPILSFTGTSDVSPHGEHQVQVYCVQTQAIQQYALDISQCLPPPIEISGIEKSESSVSHDTVNLPRHNPSESKSSEAPHSTPGPSNDVSVPEVSSETNAAHELNTSYMDSVPTSLLSASSLTGISPVAPPPLPLSPRLSRKASDIRSDHTFSDYPVDRQMDSPQTSSSSMLSFNDDNRTTQGNSSDVSQPAMFQRPTHLVKPSEFMPISSADTTRATETSKKESKNQAEEMSNDSSNAEVEIKVVGEAGISRSVEPVHPIDHTLLSDRNEKSFCSQASDLGADMTREFCATPSQPSIVEEARNSILEALSQPSHSGDEEDEVSNDVSPTPVSEGKKLTERNSQESAEISQGSITGSSIQSFDTAFQHIVATAETLKEMMASMKEVQEMQKQMSATVAVPVTKEGKRLEAAVSRCVEKATKANADALWARMQEEMAKHEKLIRDRSQQITGSLLKEFPPVLERVLKKEIAALGTNITRAVIPAIEKTISAAITESFQRGVGDKAASQLEKSVTSKLEPTVARHIQAQFQTSGKQALQDGLKSCVEASIIPAFEATCKAMFDQIDVALQKGIVEHTQAAQHQVETNHSQLALALRDSLSSASSLTQSLSGEIADGHRKLLALAAAGAKSNSGNQLVTQLSNGPLAGLHEKVDLDPTKELSRLISEHKYEEAFTSALQRSDVSIVSWLCSQVDLQRMLTLMPLPLSQGVLLSLLQQLACDITKDTTRKLGWMMDVASCIVPHDPMIAVHARPILEQVYQILNHQRSLPTTTPAEISSIRVIMHVINSMLMAYK